MVTIEDKLKMKTLVHQIKSISIYINVSATKSRGVYIQVTSVPSRDFTQPTFLTYILVQFENFKTNFSFCV